MATAEARELAIPVCRIVRLSEIPESWNEAWDRLADDTAEPNPFFERWFLIASRVLLNDKAQEPFVATIWRANMMIGLVPLCSSQRYGRMPFDHTTNWAHYHSFYGAPLVKRGDESAFWDGLLRALDQAEWTGALLHMTALDPAGPVFKALGATRRCDVVHHSERAMLASPLGTAAYYETNVRKKKRKEIGRLMSRLKELGDITTRKLHDDDELRPWIDTFLLMESAGWKGNDGAALARNADTQRFFFDALTGARQAKRLEMLCLSVGGQPIAMLVNFLTPPGSYSFKIAFDEDFARYSPGVLISIDNLDHLDRRDVEWMDSCAVPDHPMINSIWAERRGIVRVTVPLRGLKRRIIFNGARTLEQLSALRRRGQ
jgi:CelD/BcsL family acetyltransferase involved in cellulose biosynthesis